MDNEKVRAIKAPNQDSLLATIEDDYNDAVAQLREAEMTRNDVSHRLAEVSEEILRLQGAVFALNKLRKPIPVSDKKENP